MKVLGLICVAVFGGCDTVMEDTMSEMRSLLGDAREETAAHLDLAGSAQDRSQIQEEMVRHETVMEPLMGDLDEKMDRLGRRCYGQGLGGMRAKHGALDGELAYHRAEMSSPTTDVRFEIDRHANAVLPIYGAMETALGTMTCE